MSPALHGPGLFVCLDAIRYWQRQFMEPDGKDPADLSDEQLEALQRKEDGEDEDHDPAVDTVKDEAGDDVVDPPKEPEAKAEAKPDTPDPAAAQDAGADKKIDGVASKDGSRVLPYSALQAERRAARAATGRATALERELEDAKKQLADFKAGKVPIGDVTEEDVAQMEADFPEQGAKLRALFEKAQAAPAAAKPQATDDDDPAARTQELIDQVPLLLKWQHEDREKFDRASEIDAVLMKSPKWASKPTLDRFQHVAEMVADEYDVPIEKPKASTTPPAATPVPTPAPIDPAKVAQRKPPETLSDFKGGATPDHDSLDITRASPRALLSRFQNMTDEEIDAQLAKLG